MAPEVLVFMPNGDVTLRLIRNVMRDAEPQVISSLDTSAPDLHFSALEQSERDESTNNSAEAGQPADFEEESAVYFAPDAPEMEDSPSYPPTPRARRDSDEYSGRNRSASPPASFWAALKRQQATIRGTGEEEKKVAAPLEPTPKVENVVVSSHEVHCVVSSRHMMHASEQFHRILSGNYSEGITLRNKGHVVIPLSADLDAMIILLNIIHGASRKVPRQVSLEVLKKLAVLVCELGMLETVQFFSDTWIDNFQRLGLPTSYNDNVLPLVYIFWAFDRSSEFKDMTRIAQRESDENLEKNVGDIPIPHSIIDGIKRDREFAIETAVTVIHTLITRYMEGRTICDGAIDDDLRYACDAMVLGSLMKSSRKIGIWPKPESPFSGRKFKDLARTIRGIKILDVCNKSRSRRLTSLSLPSNCHSLEDSIKTSMQSLEAGLDGLKLSDYARNSENHVNGLQKLIAASSNIELKLQLNERVKEASPVYANEITAPPLTGAKKHILTESPKQTTRLPVSIDIHKRDDSPIPKQNSGNFQQEDKMVSLQAESQIVHEIIKEQRYLPSRVTSNENVRPISAIIEPVAHYQRDIMSPPPRETKQTVRDEIKVLTERKLNRTTSFSSLNGDDAKPATREGQVTPRVSSIEEITEEISATAKEDAKRLEVREILNDNLTTTDEEMTSPPHNFKIRMSKNGNKRFSKRF